MKAEEKAHVEAPSTAEVDPPKEPGRIAWLFNKSIRWTAGIAGIFAIGVVLTMLVRVLPLTLDLRSVRNDLAAANDQLASQEEALADMDALEASLSDLRAEYESSEVHVALLRIMMDVSAARLSMANDDSLGARAALSETDDRLSALQEALEGENANAVVAMRVRLQQVISEIDSNAFAAEGDLSILHNDLQTLEETLFTE